MFLDFSGDIDGYFQCCQRLPTRDPRLGPAGDAFKEIFEFEAEWFILHHRERREIDSHGRFYAKTHGVLTAVIE